jgi:hypothetical protein
MNKAASRPLFLYVDFTTLEPCNGEPLVRGVSFDRFEILLEPFHGLGREALGAGVGNLDRLEYCLAPTSITGLLFRVALDERRGDGVDKVERHHEEPTSDARTAQYVSWRSARDGFSDLVYL